MSEFCRDFRTAVDSVRDVRRRWKMWGGGGGGMALMDL